MGETTRERKLMHSSFKPDQYTNIYQEGIQTKEVTIRTGKQQHINNEKDMIHSQNLNK